jgi:thioredoxin-related protein
LSARLAVRAPRCCRKSRVWQNELKDKINFVFISSGNDKDNLEKFGGGAKQILLQKNKEVSELFGAQWTPTVLLVNSDGTIASYLAAGDKAIRELIDKIKSKTFADESVFISNGDGAALLGTQLPEISQADVNGKNIASKDLLGKKTLVTFWSMTCPFCVNMLDDLRDWDESKDMGEPNLLVISEGDIEANRSMNIQSPVILDTNRNISKKLGMKGTPSAVLIDENGKIVSETAVGANQIWTLLGKR